MITLNYQLQRFHDLDLLQHFLIVHKLSGVCLFYHPFKKMEIQFDLISGFISAMSSMYAEFTGEGEDGNIESLKYQGMIVNGFTGNHTMGILIADGDISTSFILSKFIEAFESRYENVLKNWDGIMSFFEPEWIVKQLYDEIGYFSNLPFIVSSKKPKKLYSKPMVFLQARCNSHYRFLIRNVLADLKKFLDISEANTFDVLMMLKLEGLISHTPIEDILEPTVQAGAMLETFSSDIGAEVKIEYPPVQLDEMIDTTETKPTEITEIKRDALESSTSDIKGVFADASSVDVKETDYGMYSVEGEVSLKNVIHSSGDEWLREIASEVISLHLGRSVVITNPQYIPIGFDSSKCTLRIKITGFVEDQ